MGKVRRFKLWRGTRLLDPGKRSASLALRAGTLGCKSVTEGIRHGGGWAMPEMTRYEHGVPSWVDIGIPRPGRGRALLLGAVRLGWPGHGEEAGHYTIAAKDGKQVAAISPAQDPGPPRWTTYINVDDVDETARKVESAGGTVIVAPMDVMTAAAWRSSRHHRRPHRGLAARPAPRRPAGQRPGSFTWSELSELRSRQVEGVLLRGLRLGLGRRRRLPRSPGERPHHRRAHAPAARHARRRARQLACPSAPLTSTPTSRRRRPGR